MSDLLTLLAEPLQLSFMRNAMIAIVLVGIVCGAIGVFVTLRGLAFMGDAMAHAVFPGLVIAYVLGGNFLIGALIAATLVSLAIGFVTQSSLLRNDTAIGVFFPTALNSFAVVYLLISLLVHTKCPCAPDPLACTTRSGMRSRLKWAIFSKSRKSSNTTGPRGPTVSEF